MSQDFSHFDPRGNAAMVDVGAKPVTERTATARARVAMLPATAALTVYDMCKSVDRGMRIEAVRLTHKAGGKSGEFVQD